MGGMIRMRLLKLEQAVKAKETAMSEEVLYAVFEAMKISYDDLQLIDAIHDRGEPLAACTEVARSSVES